MTHFCKSKFHLFRKNEFLLIIPYITCESVFCDFRHTLSNRTLSLTRDKAIWQGETQLKKKDDDDVLRRAALSQNYSILL